MADDSVQLTRQLTSHLDTYLDEQTGELTEIEPDDLSLSEKRRPRVSTDDDEMASRARHDRHGPNVRFLLGHATDIGGGQANQDKSFYNTVGSHLIMGVFDGHGRELGEDAAIVARDQIKTMLSTEEKIIELLNDPVNVFNHIFETCHTEIKKHFHQKYSSSGWEVMETAQGYLVKRRNGGPWACTHGGTTATVIVISDDRVISANVGDSSALWGRFMPGLDRPVFKELSGDHSPESMKEFIRIREFMPEGSNLYPEMRFVYDAPSFAKHLCPPIFTVDPTDKSKITLTNSGNYYKNVRNEWASLVTTPRHAKFQDALAFTRSLGDLHLHVYGVTFIPEVNEYSLSDLHTGGLSSLLLCTDGVWDNWTYADALAAVLENEMTKNAATETNSQSACDIFMKRNMAKAFRNFGNHADNMTAILCYIITE